MTREVLFLSHRLPFPPDRGDKIRSHHVLKRIAALAPVHVATFADDERDLAEEFELAALARSYKLVRRRRPLALSGLEALLRREPVSLTAFHNVELAAYVERVLREHPIGTIYVFSGQMGQYVPDWFQGRVIVDFVDVDSAKFGAYAERERGVKRWIHAREERLLRAEECRVAGRADTSLLISRAEAALFAARLNPAVRVGADIRVLPNGVDTHFFDPSRVRPEPMLRDRPGPKLIFTGQMDYAPNVTAAMRVARRVLPLLRRTMPEASFHVVGRNPAAELQVLDGKDGVHVWGGVEDIRPWLAGADLALVALEIARGVQNKVLEAMAMGLPVVLTPGAATGIEAQDGKHFAVAESDEALAQLADDLVSRPDAAAAMGKQARGFVVDTMAWPAALAPLSDLLGYGAAARLDAA